MARSLRRSRTASGSLLPEEPEAAALSAPGFERLHRTQTASFRFRAEQRRARPAAVAPGPPPVAAETAEAAETAALGKAPGFERLHRTQTASFRFREDHRRALATVAPGPPLYPAARPLSAVATRPASATSAKSAASAATSATRASSCASAPAEEACARRVAAAEEGARRELRLCLLCDRVFRARSDAPVVDCPTCLARLPQPGRDERHADEAAALVHRVPEVRRQRAEAAKAARAAASRRRSRLPPLPPAGGRLVEIWR